MECKSCRCELTNLEVRAGLSECARCYISKEEEK